MALTKVEIKLRKAVESDCESIYHWRNHEKTRQFIFDPQVISLEDHTMWFSKSLKNRSRQLLIAEQAGRPVGVLRYDFDEKNQAEVSIYLVPGEEGKGYGAELLKAGNHWLASVAPDTTTVIAQVLPENKASLKSFENAGYTEFAREYHYDLKSEGNGHESERD